VEASTGQLIGAIVVFVVGIFMSIVVGRSLKTPTKRTLVLYSWHTLFCIVYLGYALNYGADSIAYYQKSLTNVPDLSLGTSAVTYFTSFISSGLGLSILGVFLVFNIFGSVGLLAFDASMRAVTADKRKSIRRLATLIVFAPSVSFWSSAIGKDSLAFMATGLFLWAVTTSRRRIWLMAFSAAVMLLVRPHVSALMVAALLVSSIFESRMTLRRRVVLGVGALVCSLILLPLAMNYSGLGSDADGTDVIEYVEERQTYNMKGGGAVDISSMSLPLQMLTYLFRPLPYEAHSLTSLAVSVENVGLIALLLWAGAQWINGRKFASHVDWVFLAVFSVSTWVILATTTANLGIAVRQKWMFLPMIILLAVSLIGKRRKQVVAPPHAQAIRPWNIGDHGTP